MVAHLIAHRRWPPPRGSGPGAGVVLASDEQPIARIELVRLGEHGDGLAFGIITAIVLHAVPTSVLALDLVEQENSQRKKEDEKER